MASFGSFAALLPTFLNIWSLSSTDAGWISGIYYAGYLVAVPVLVGMTDKVDSRNVYYFGAALNIIAALGFAFWAEGFWTALVLRAMAGAGLAGTYMTGLKALTDRIGDRQQSRSVAFYTSSFSIGAGLSYLMAGWIAEALDWRWAFGLASAGSVVSVLLFAALLKPHTPAVRPDRNPFDFRPVFRNRRAMGYVLAYTAHNWELFGLRSWIVAFFVFSQGLQSEGATGVLWDAAVLAALINWVGLPASVLGNEGAHKFGRRRMVYIYMGISAVLACLVGWTASWPFAVVVALMVTYAFTVSWDSSSITAGVVAAAREGERGATMAVHSMVGFIGAFTGPLVFGVVLDWQGGVDSLTAWGLAFGLLGLGVALGPVALMVLGRDNPATGRSKRGMS